MEEVCRKPELGVSMLLFTFVEFLGMETMRRMRWVIPQYYKGLKEARLFVVCEVKTANMHTSVTTQCDCINTWQKVALSCTLLATAGASLVVSFERKRVSGLRGRRLRAGSLT